MVDEHEQSQEYCCPGCKDKDSLWDRKWTGLIFGRYESTAREASNEDAECNGPRVVTHWTDHQLPFIKIIGGISPKCLEIRDELSNAALKGTVKYQQNMKRMNNQSFHQQSTR